MRLSDVRDKSQLIDCAWEHPQAGLIDNLAVIFSQIDQRFRFKIMARLDTEVRDQTFGEVMFFIRDRAEELL